MEQEMQHSNDPSPAIIFDILLAYQRTAALRAAVELDLFKAVGEGPADAAALAAKCAASERGTRILCDYLVIMELLTKEDGQYSHTPTSSVFLDPRSPACVASITRFLASPEMLEPFNHLSDIVRNGRTTLPGEGSVSPENPIWVDFARSMAPMMAPLSGPLSAIVLEGQESSAVQVLDIAAGHGLFGIEVAKQNPAAHITALDWAAVLEVALENASKAGVADRFSTLPGSAFDAEYGGPYDIVLLTNFLHHFDEYTCVGLLRKVRASLKPGGRAATLEFVPNEDRVSPPMAARFSMTMLGTTAAGDAYTYRELESMYRKAGYESISGHPIPMSPHTVVMGRVPD